VQTLEREPHPAGLEINDIGHVAITVAEPLPLDDYERVAATGAFLVIDPQAGDTLAAGMRG
jgi:sulfate adenylyltransferase subunit 1